MANLIDQPKIHTLEELLSPATRQFKVPVYQRNYEWTAEQIDDFLDDIFGICDLQGEHFFGTMVFSNESPGSPDNQNENIKYVIDGQQRLITCLLFICAIRHQLIELFHKHEVDTSATTTELNDLTVSKHLIDAGTRRPRLSANRNNQNFLTPILVQMNWSYLDVLQKFAELDDETKLTSQSILDAYERIRYRTAQRIAEKADCLSDKQSSDLAEMIEDQTSLTSSISEIHSLLSEFLTKTLFIEISVRKRDDAFGIFEGLNNRGLDLSQQDLVKNALLSKAHTEHELSDTELNHLEQRWEKITTRIASSKFSKFLRHYLLLFYKDVPLKKVVKQLNIHFSTKSATEMIDELERAASAYEKITKPSLETTKSVKDALIRINALEAERSYPIPLAAKLKALNSTDMIKLLNAVENLYFRRSAIMGRDNKSIEADFREVASLIFEKGKKGLPEAIRKLRELTPEDDEFKEQFVRRQGMKDSIARYMLVQFENRYPGRQSRLKKIDYSEATLEHIMPREASLWKLSKGEMEKHSTSLGRIGNLTLLTNKKNSSVSNKPFHKKKAAYLEEHLSINAYVIDCDRWTSIEIATRQYQLSELATKIWAK